MIKGVGVDIVNLKRIEKLLQCYGKKFLERVLCKEEIEEANKRENKAEFVGGRFAVKEAIKKAFDKNISFKEICILQNADGKIFLRGYQNVFISISHEKDFAIGLAIRVEI
ncbi:MAG: holo-ACP synthase [Caldisericaceae bacterium]